MSDMTTTSTLFDRATAAINETCNNDPWFQQAIAQQNQRKAIDANVEAIRQAAVRAANPDAAAKVAARRAARAAG